MHVKLRLSGILEQSTVNGVGLRKVYFSQGCSHHCKGCFNPETWDFKKGKLFDMDKLLKVVSQETYLDGVTFSGGDPFQQADKFAIFAKKLKQKKINIWSYTGYKWEYLVKKMKTDKNIKQLLENIDVLVDGRFEKNFHKEGLKYRGSTNQKFIDVQKSLSTNKKVTLTY